MLISLWDLRAWLNASWLVRLLTTDKRNDQLNQLVDSLGLGHHRHVIYVYLYIYSSRFQSDSTKKFCIRIIRLI